MYNKFLWFFKNVFFKVILDVRLVSFFSNIIEELREVYRFRYVVFSFVESNLKLRYRRSILGFIWTVLAPMLNYLVIGIVFSLLMGSRRPDYFAYYFSGALFFALIAGVLAKAPHVFIGNEHFIKKIYLPKLLFVFNSISIEFVNFLLSATALVLLGIISGEFKFSICAPLAIIPIFLVGVALLGVSCIVGVMSVYFRDFVHIIPVAVQALFFVTPIIYDESMIPEKYHWLIQYNPASYYLQIFREPLLNGQIPAIKIVVLCAAFSLVILVIGLGLVKQFDNRIVFKL